MNTKSLEQAFREAQGAVSFIPEGPYRVAAFQVRLSELSVQPSTAALPGKATNIPVKGTAQASTPKSDTKARILEMLGAGYFDQPHSPSEARSELRTRGFHHNPQDVRMTLLRLARSKQLRRLREGERDFRYAKP